MEVHFIDYFKSYGLLYTFFGTKMWYIRGITRHRDSHKDIGYFLKFIAYYLNTLYKNDKSRMEAKFNENIQFKQNAIRGDVIILADFFVRLQNKQ